MCGRSWSESRSRVNDFEDMSVDRPNSQLCGARVRWGMWELPASQALLGMSSGALVTTHDRKRVLTEEGERERRVSPQLGVVGACLYRNIRTCPWNNAARKR